MDQFIDLNKVKAQKIPKEFITTTGGGSLIAYSYNDGNEDCPDFLPAIIETMEMMKKHIGELEGYLESQSYIFDKFTERLEGDYPDLATELSRMFDAPEPEVEEKAHPCTGCVRLLNEHIIGCVTPNGACSRYNQVHYEAE
jgi:hypothetical protein